MKMFKPEKQQISARADIEAGDDVYVQHGGQPRAGRVLCHGKHGMTVDIDGQKTQKKWDAFLGHKKRSALKFDVLEHGEDGMLVRDSSGRKRFIRVPEASRDMGELAKSLTAFGAMPKNQGLKMQHGERDIFLFFKAFPVAGKPAPGEQGTQVQESVKKPAPGADAVDENGESAEVGAGWNERAQGAGAAKMGQHVAFRNGEHRGHGEVKAVGESGVTVADKAGGQHRVLHDQVTHEWAGDGEPGNEPPPDEDADENVLGGYDGKVALPGELVAKLLETAPRDVRAKAAAFLREKAAGDEVEQNAISATKQQKQPDQK